MTHIDCDKIPRDCHNCDNAVPRRMPPGSVLLTLVCMRNACGVRPDELKDTGRTPCGTAVDIIDGVVPRHWRKARE